MSSKRTPQELTVPVTEEQLEVVGRAVVDTGRAVRVRKAVDQVASPVASSVTTESVRVHRVPVGRVVAEPPPVRQEGDVTVFPVLEERLVTRKELVLVEEVHLVRHREVSRTESDVLLRRERVIVERFDAETGKWLPDPGSDPQQPTPKEQ